MKMFEVDCGGAVYWLAARDESDAGAVFVCGLRAEGLGEEEITEILDETTYSVESRESRPGLVLKGGGNPDRPMWDVFDELTEPQVIACSEWP